MTHEWMPGWFRRAGRFVLSFEARQNALHEWRRRRLGESPPLPKTIRTVLAVCHGNICRSPFAEALLASRRKDLVVRSAGFNAGEGKPAEAGAVEAAHDFGVELDSHAAHRLGDDDVKWADLILGMEGHHATLIKRRWPDAARRTRLLGDYLPSPPHTIEDPWGQSDEIFEATFERISVGIDRLAELFQEPGE